MIPILRTVQPDSLSSQATQDEADRAEIYYQTWKLNDGAYKTFRRYKEHDVKEALFGMSQGKCAYCEGYVEKGSLEVEHYRPKGSVEGSDHPGYWWLALNWKNLLPACAACNKEYLQHIVTANMSVEEVEELKRKTRKQLYGKGTHFPVSRARRTAASDRIRGQLHGSANRSTLSRAQFTSLSDGHFLEGPLIIDPTRVDPEPHLRWRSDTAYSVVEPATVDGSPSDLGVATINCVALNRIDLVKTRTQVLQVLQTQRIQIMDDLENDAVNGASPEAIQMALRCALRRIEDMKRTGHSNQIYSGMVKAFIREFAAEFEEFALSRGIASI